MDLSRELSPDRCPGQISWHYDRAEIIADGVVHAIGVCLGLLGAITIVVISINTERVDVAPILVYVIGLVTMLAFSAAYNMWPVSPAKWVLRRFDHTDISLDPGATLLGDDWFRALARSRVDARRGGRRQHPGSRAARSAGATMRYVADHPDATYDEIEAACFPGRDGELALFAISPRHLEACATRTGQILVEGTYSGALEPGRHYLSCAPTCPTSGTCSRRPRTRRAAANDRSGVRGHRRVRPLHVPWLGRCTSTGCFSPARSHGEPVAARCRGGGAHARLAGVAPRVVAHHQGPPAAPRRPAAPARVATDAHGRGDRRVGHAAGARRRQPHLEGSGVAVAHRDALDRRRAEGQHRVVGRRSDRGDQPVAAGRAGGPPHAAEEALPRPLWGALRPLVDAVAPLASLASVNRKTAMALPAGDLYWVHSAVQLPAVAVVARYPRRAVRLRRPRLLLGLQEQRGPQVGRPLAHVGVREVERLFVRFAAERVTVGMGVKELQERHFGRSFEVLHNAHDHRLDRASTVNVREALGLGDDAFLVVAAGNSKEGTSFEPIFDALAALPSTCTWRSSAATTRGRRSWHAPAAWTAACTSCRRCRPRRSRASSPAPTRPPSSTGRSRPTSSTRCRTASTRRSPPACRCCIRETMRAIRALCEEHDLGVPIDPRDAGSVLAGIQRLLDDPRELARLRANARQAAQHVNWEREEAKLNALVRELVAR